MNALLDFLLSERGCLALAVLGALLAVLTLRILSRPLFWLLLLLAVGCLGFAGTQYWRIATGRQGASASVHQRFLTSIREGMSEADVWDLMVKLYPHRNGLDRPSMKHQPTGEAIITIPADPRAGTRERRIHLTYQDGLISSIRTEAGQP